MAEVTDILTVREAVYDLLRRTGMTTIFGNPGSTELPMFRDFPAEFRYVLGLQESVVLGMADGFAQATRRAALVNLHSAAGVGHALGNLFTAFKNQTPLVVTAGQQARAILPFEPFLFAQDATDFPKPYVKWAIEPARAADVPQAIARAWHMAMQPPQGPTFVSIPIDDWDQPCSPVEPRSVESAQHPRPEQVARLRAALDAARCPTFVVGAGVSRDDAWDELVALAEQHRACVWVAPMSARNGFPEGHPLFAGFLGATREQIVRDLAPHDLILSWGGPLSLYHTDGRGPHLPPGARLFQITDNLTHAVSAPVGDALVASIKEVARQLLGGCRPERPWPARRAAAPDPDHDRLTDALLLSRIAALRPSGAAIVEEAPSSRPAMHDHLPIIERDSFYTCASGGLGHGLPAAIGVSLGRPDKKVIAFLGDGSAMYGIQGLWTAARMNLPITFIICNNSRYEALHQFGQLFQLKDIPGVELGGIDFVALAASLGIPGARVDTARHLDRSLAEAFTRSGPYLVEVTVD